MRGGEGERPRGYGVEGSTQNARLLRRLSSWEAALARISAPVGEKQINHSADVKTVQVLLNSHIDMLAPLDRLSVDGNCGSLTTKAIEAFQIKVVKLSTPDRVVSPAGPTLLALRGAILPKAPSTTQAAQTPDNPGGLSDDLYVQAATTLVCEAAAVKAVVATELGILSAFDPQGRPTILFERHRFSALTNGKFDTSNPDISNPVPGGYGKFSEQYPKLDRAMKLDRVAALESASWGAFQIMGENYDQAGFSCVDDFVSAMQTSVESQLKAFIKFVSGNITLVKALRDKDWTSFARIYNGSGYKVNNYDGKMKANYNLYLQKL